MEPMTLGSPTSPVNFTSQNALPGSSTSQPAPFLPSYLLGGNHTTNSRVSMGGSSPSSSRHFGSQGQHSPASPFSTKETMPPSFHTPKFGRFGDRPSGPPVQGLGSPAGTPLQQQQHHRSPFPDLSRNISSRTPMGSPHIGYSTPQSSAVMSTSSTFHLKDQLNASIISTEIHSDVAATDSLLHEWVTVFGFPVAAASYILTQFAQVGTIVDQRMAGSGNWMHLKFQTPLQARKALSLNSKIFGNNIMIGVVGCTDKSLLQENKENRMSLLNTTPLRPNTSQVTSQLESSFSTPKANIRSLTQAYPTTPSDNQVTPATNTPKKNDSLISKAMQHILGV